MGIDIRTVIFIAGISHLMQTLVFFYQYKINRNLKGPFWWLLWSAAESIGFTLIFLRNIPQLLQSIIVFQNFIILSGIIFLYIGVLRFFEKKPNHKIIILALTIFAAIQLFFIFVKDDIYIRTLLISSSVAVISFVIAVSVYKNKSKSVGVSANFNIVIFAIHGCIYAYRVILFILQGSSTDILTSNFNNDLVFFDSLFAGLLWTFGFIIMLNQKLNSEISATKTRYEHIFNISPDAVVISRLSDGLFIDCNESYSKMSGYSKNEMSGKTSMDINIWNNPEDRQLIIDQIREKGYCENYEALFQPKDGKLLAGLLSAKIMDLDGVPHLISVTRNINYRKVMEDEIKLKNEQLVSFNAEKDKFFSIIAHDLKSPFMGFLGLTKMIAEETSSYTLQELALMGKEMHQTANNLFRLLKNLLEWAQMQQGLMKFYPMDFPISDLVDDCIQTLEMRSGQKKITITNMEPCSIKVFADRNMVNSVLLNLLSNAIKFTQSNGKISIYIKETDDNMIEVSVMDSGVGIPQSDLQKLFKVGNRVSTRGTDGELSTGLGLLLSKEFVIKQGGTIKVESEENIGSAFRFTLPKFS